MIASYISGIRKDNNETIMGYLIECPDKLPESMHDKKDVNMKTFIMLPDGDTGLYEIYPDTKEFIGFFNTYAGTYHSVGKDGLVK